MPVLIVDALNLFTRHYIANPTMSAGGRHIGGMAGFLRNIQLLAEKISPTNIYIIWEGGGSIRRRAIYPEYKGGRRPPKLNRFYADSIPDTTQNRNYQVALTVEALKHVPVGQLYISDCEADDVIGYLAARKFLSKNCVIVSSDKDFYQLIDDRVSQWSPGQKAFVTSESVMKRFGIPPHNFCTARCFCGDPSDSLPGIKGAGFKTLGRRFPELLQSDFVSVSEIIKLSEQQHAHRPLLLYKRIIEGADIALRNWKLMHLDTGNLAATQIQKIESYLDTFSPNCDKIGLMRMLVREGFATFDVDKFCMVLNSSIKRG